MTNHNNDQQGQGEYVDEKQEMPPPQGVRRPSLQARQIKSKRFAEINIGDSAEFQTVVTKEMHSWFSKIISDSTPINTSDEFASGTKFKVRIGYGFLLTAFLSRLYGEYLPGGSSICVKQESKFVRPYFPGDTLLVKARVIHKTPSTQLVEIKSEIFRMPANEKVFEGLGTVQIIA